MKKPKRKRPFNGSIVGIERVISFMGRNIKYSLYSKIIGLRGMVNHGKVESPNTTRPTFEYLGE